MRTVIIVALVVAVACGALCVVSVAYIDETTDELSDMAMQLMDYAEAEDYKRASETLVIMANQWERHRPILEMISDHEDLHTVTEHLVESQVHLKYEHANDFYQSMALLDESLRHIRDSERISIANIF